MGRALLLSLLWLPAALASCPCQVSTSPCRETAASTVFIGTVEAMTPRFLDHWNVSRRPSLQLLNTADDRYLKDPSAANLAALKSAFLTVFPDLAEDLRQRLQSAATRSDLASIFSSVLGHGRLVRFKVKTVFHEADDDDDGDKDKKNAAKKDDLDDAKERSWDVWTPFGDCGYDFQQGETYLVYAANDEDSSILETDRCTRTNRLTDAGPDLAYLYFLKNTADASARLDGFVTTNPLYQKELGPQQTADRITSPVSGVVLELQTARGPRYSTSDPAGRFIFDGLPTGDYQLSAFAGTYPDPIQLLSGPRKIHIETKSCNSQVMLIPKPPDPPH